MNNGNIFLYLIQTVLTLSTPWRNRNCRGLSWRDYRIRLGGSLKVSLDVSYPFLLQLPVLVGPSLVLLLPGPAGALVARLLPLGTLGAGPTVLLPQTAITFPTAWGGWG